MLDKVEQPLRKGNLNRVYERIISKPSFRSLINLLTKFFTLSYDVFDFCCQTLLRA